MFLQFVSMRLSVTLVVISIAIADPSLKAQTARTPRATTQATTQAIQTQEVQTLEETVNPMRRSQVSTGDAGEMLDRRPMESAIIGQIAPPMERATHAASPTRGFHSSSSHSGIQHAANRQPATFQPSSRVSKSASLTSENNSGQSYGTRPAEFVPHQPAPLVRSDYRHASSAEPHTGNSAMQNAPPAVSTVTFQQSQPTQTLNQNRTERDWLHHVNQLSAPTRDRRTQSDQQASDNSGKASGSFIQREREADQSKPSVAMVPTTRIAVNLAIVLAAAIGVLLMIRLWQQGKGSKNGLGIPGNLSVVQVLPLAGGASLHVVDGFQKRVLLAIDATGIKSVDVIDASFDQSMNQVDAIATSGATQSTFQAIADAASKHATSQHSAHDASNSTPSNANGNSDSTATVGAVSSQRRKLRAERNRASAARTKDPRAEALEITPTPDIDQQLMELLLRNGSKAA